MEIEAYIRKKRPRGATVFRAGAGEIDNLEQVGLYYYNYRELPIDISDYITEDSFGAWHENTDEDLFTRFDASDLSIKLSLLKGEITAGVRTPSKENFYAKLQANPLYREFQQLKNRATTLDKLEKWTLSIWIPEKNKAWWGEIDLHSIIINEGDGTVSFSSYGGLKALALMPVSAATYRDGLVMKWKKTISPEDAFHWVWDTGGSFHASLFLSEFDYNIHPGGIGFEGWMLGFESVPDTIDDRNVIDLRWDGSYLWLLCEGDDDYKIAIDDEDEWTWTDTSELSASWNYPFFRWEATTGYSAELPAPTTFYTELVRASVMNIIPAIPGWVAGYYDYASGYYYALSKIWVGSPSGWDYTIHKTKFNGYNAAGVPQWGATAVVTIYQDFYSYGPNFDIFVHPTTGYIFWSRDKDFFLYDGVSHSEIEVNTNAAFYDFHYLYATGHLLNRYDESGSFVNLNLRNSATGAVTGLRAGEIPTLNDYSSYNLNYEDIDLSSLFEITLDEFSGTGSEILIAGITRGTPKRFFLLNDDLTRCVYYTNLEQATGVSLGSKCFITRRLKEITVGGVTTYRTYIHGYIGDGSIKNGVFFSYKIGGTGNIRILNLDKMNMAQFLSELATFSNSYLFVDNKILTDGEGRHLAYPEINLIDRSLFAAGISLWSLDNEWTQFKINPSYKNLKGVVNVKFNGGEIKVGAGVGIDYGTTYDYLDLSYFPEVESLSISCKFVFDLNYAQYLGRLALSFLWVARQHWTIGTKMQDIPYRLLDRVNMHTIDAAQEDKQGIIIAIDFDPLASKSATLRVITAGENDIYHPENPIIAPETITQIGHIGGIT